MTVAELIEKLAAFPPDMPVVIDDDDLGFVEVETIEQGSIDDDDHKVVVLNYE
jgi:hypothetical protein